MAANRWHRPCTHQPFARNLGKRESKRSPGARIAAHVELTRARCRRIAAKNHDAQLARLTPKLSDGPLRCLQVFCTVARCGGSRFEWSALKHNMGARDGCLIDRSRVGSMT